MAYTMPLEAAVLGQQAPRQHDGPFAKGVADQGPGHHHLVGCSSLGEIVAVAHRKRFVDLAGGDQDLTLAVGGAQGRDKRDEGALLLQHLVQGQVGRGQAFEAARAIAVGNGGQGVVHQPHLGCQLQAQTARLVPGDGNAQVHVGTVIGMHAEPGGKAQQGGHHQVAEHDATQKRVGAEACHLDAQGPWRHAGSPNVSGPGHASNHRLSGKSRAATVH